MSQALYRKWRPSTWDQVVGQEHIVTTLRNAVASGRVGHAYLFAGPRGTGKTSVARILAKAANCLHDDPAARPDDDCEYCQAVNQARFLDLIEIDAASNTSVEHVRDLRDKVNFAPNQARFKVYIIDEVHMLSTAAFNALLKTLEEPPAHAIFVLATTEVHKIPATVLSRCQRHEFRRLPVVDMVARLEQMAKDESITVEAEALQLVARQATGSLRDAISLLDQLAAGGETITLQRAHTILGTSTSQAVLDLVDALLEKDAKTGFDRIHATLDSGSDARQFARQVVDYLRGVLLVSHGTKVQEDMAPEVRPKMAAHAQSFPRPDLLSAINQFNQAASATKGNWQPSLALEMAFMQSLDAAGPIPSSTPTPSVAGGEAKPAPKPKSKPAPAEKAEAPQQQTQGVTLDKGKWGSFVDNVKNENPNAAALLNSVRLRELRGGVLHLGFASELLKDKMEKEGNLDLALKAAEVLGEVTAIKCFITSAGQSGLPPEIDSSGMVAAAVRLGGEIVDSNEINPPSGE